MEIKNVNKVKGGNRYCGPAVISAVVGCTTDDAARVLRDVSGKPAIKGVHRSHVAAAFELFGVRMHPLAIYKKEERPTLASWLRESSSMRSAGRVFLLIAGNHYQLVSGRRYVCGVVRQVVSLTHEGVKRRARVERVYELTAPNGIAMTAGNPLRAAAKPSASAKTPSARNAEAARRKAKQLAAQHDIEIDEVRDTGIIWVYPPSGVFCEEENDGRPEDPHADEHWCDDWDTALRRVQSYAKWLTENVIPAEAE